MDGLAGCNAWKRGRAESRLTLPKHCQPIMAKGGSGRGKRVRKLFLLLLLLLLLITITVIIIIIIIIIILADDGGGA